VLSGLRGRIYPLSPEPAAFSATVDSIGARYVVYDRLDAASDIYLRSVLLRKPSAFCLMRVAPASGTVLFGIRPDHATVPDLGEAAVANPGDISFQPCPPEYWRDDAAMRQFGGG
jgi:hypothetical protein